VNHSTNVMFDRYHHSVLSCIRFCHSEVNKKCSCAQTKNLYPRNADLVSKEHRKDDIQKVGYILPFPEACVEVFRHTQHLILSRQLIQGDLKP
jgi:hypothetical protein